MRQHLPSRTSANPPNISDAKRALLEKLLRGETQQQPTSPLKIRPRPDDSAAQLSFAQERLWFLDQLNPASAVFNVPLSVRLSSAIDPESLERSINEIVRRHDALRTTVATVDGQPQPITSPSLKVDLIFHDLTAPALTDREARAQAILREEAHRPFDLSKGPLIRATLVRLDTQDHFFVVVMHHIVSDGWSLVLFFQELKAIYDAYAHGRPSPLAENPIQYADYAAWQRKWLQGDRLQNQLSYWREKLGGELPVLDLPTDRTRSAIQTFPGRREWLALSKEMTASLKALAQRRNATLFITLLAAFKVLLYRYTGQEDIIVGSPIANRPQAETEELIGFFLNNLALRSDLSGDPSFAEVLDRVKQTALDGYAHQDVPFEKLIEELKPERNLSRTPIFQVYFNLFNFADAIKVPGSDNTVSFVDAWAQSDEDLSKFDLTLYAGEQDRELKLALVYNTDLFDAASITRLLAHFKTLLEGIVTHPEATISTLPLRAEFETLPGLPEVRPAVPFTYFPKEEIEQSIADRFAAQVEQHPERIAVKSDKHKWTYAGLDRISDEIAHAILARRADDEQRIALLFEHDAPMIAAMLGALKAGTAYVPLDPHHPRERLARIVEHSQAGMVLTNNRNLFLAKQVANAGVQLINIDSVDSSVSVMPLPEVDPHSLAYILYTSGSTGEPKGVMQSHRNVLHYIRVYANNLHLNPDDRLTLLSSYCFDASVMDIYGALLNGATLYPVDIRESGLADLSGRLIDEGITVYHSTPTVYRYFTSSLNGQSDFRKLRLVVLGGEEVKRSDVDAYREHFGDDCLFVNGLGPTEATVSLQNFIDKQTGVSGDSVPVGFPVDDTEVLLLNLAGKPSEIYGEIAIKSEHVALGYWQNAEATAAAFSISGTGVPPVAYAQDARATRMYRTGDMGRRLPDGRIKFEGRKDFQVKIRGFRIELGEIESALNNHALIKESAVVARENAGGDKRLIAYVVPRDYKASVNDELRDFLKQKLPDYMVPNAFVVMDSLPLTASGKLNRRALPAPESGAGVRGTGVPPVRHSPDTPMQLMLAGIWADLLDVKEVGVDDNFFELGGHSLLAVQLFAQILKRCGKTLPLATLFQAPTVARLAAVLEHDSTRWWSSLVPIQPAGSRPPFFCVHALGGNVLEYYHLARHLGTDQPFYGLQSQGLDGKSPAHTRVEDMAAHYIKEMLEAQPAGPYFIGGRSLGGMIAFEMARQLRAQGQEVGMLALLDTYPSGYATFIQNETTMRAAFRRAIIRTRIHASNLRSLPASGKVAYVIRKARFAPRKMKSQVWRRIYHAYANLERQLPRGLRDITEFNSLAVRQYVPQVYNGPVTLFWASEDLRTSIDLVEGWRALAGGGIEVLEIPGSHLDIVKEPHVSDLARKLSACLNRAQTRQ